MMRKISKKIVTMISFAAMVTLQACGGGGSDAPAAASVPKTLADDTVALKLMALMLNEGPAGSNETRTRGDYRADWTKPSATTTTACPGRLGNQTFSEITLNADASPGVGDKFTNSANCNFRHYSTNGLNLVQEDFIEREVVALTSPLFSAATDWTIEEKYTLRVRESFELFTVTGGFSYASSSVVRDGTSNYKTVHLANDSETDSVNRSATYVEASPDGASNLRVTTRYSCKYGIGQRTDPDCTDVVTTSTGTVLGVTVNATLVASAGQPWGYEITDGSTKIIIRLKQFQTSQVAGAFTVTLPSGKVAEITARDVVWVGGY
jgi:hypothetical protein